MDWMRRNWPDLLIGLALLLVIGGIIATLLNGGNFLPFGRNPQPAPATSNPATTTPQENVSPTDPATATTATTGDTGIAPVDLNQPATGDSVSIDGQDNTIVAVPPSTDGAADPATAAIDNAVEAVATPVEDAAAPSSDAATPAPQTAAGNSSTSPYRISVGAFGSSENAERKAQSFRDAGYPVFVGRQGDLSLVLLGPYATQAEAEQVKAELQSSGLEAEPIIYELQPEDAATATTEAASSDTAAAPVATETTTPAAPAETTATTSLPTSDSGRYLQVGAYGSLEAAAPQRSVLEGLGFTVSSVEEGSYVKLLVGPYDDASLSDAQSRLAAQGIDNFVR
jgi:cell division protein FtsN